MHRNNIGWGTKLMTTAIMIGAALELGLGACASFQYSHNLKTITKIVKAAVATCMHGGDIAEGCAISVRFPEESTRPVAHAEKGVNGYIELYKNTDNKEVIQIKIAGMDGISAQEIERSINAQIKKFYKAKMNEDIDELLVSRTFLIPARHNQQSFATVLAPTN